MKESKMPMTPIPTNGGDRLTVTGFDTDDLGQPSLWDDDDTDEDPAPWNDALRVQQQLQQIRAKFEARARPLRAIQKRNGGVRLPTLVELERECERQVQALLKARQQEVAYARAAREQASGMTQARAADRQRGQANLDALARDLRGGRYAPDPQPAGRSVHDAWIW
jgi:hypothetical protein